MGRASKVNRGNHIIWVCGTTQFPVWYHTAGGKWQAERSGVRLIYHVRPSSLYSGSRHSLK